MQENNIGETELKCQIVQIRYRKWLYSICVCKTEDEIPEAALIRNPAGITRFTAVGEWLPEAGTPCILTGEWEKNEKYHQTQFRVRECRLDVGHTQEEVVQYLSRVALRGIRDETATRIYDQYGDECLTLLEENPETFLSVPGVEQDRLEDSINAYRRRRGLRNLAKVLKDDRIPFPLLLRIYRTLGPLADAQIQEDPYVLCGVPDFRFQKVDDIARKRGISARDPSRMQSCVISILQDEGRLRGHMFLPRYELIDLCCSDNWLNRNLEDWERLLPDDVDSFIGQMLESGNLVEDIRPGEEDNRARQCIYLPDAWEDEKYAAARVAEMLPATLPEEDPNSLPACLKAIEEEMGITMNDRQLLLLQAGLQVPVTLLYGAAHSGKTTVLRVLIELLCRIREEAGEEEPEIALIAPNGAVADQIEAEYEESSLVNAHMFAVLLSRLRSGARLIMAGDLDRTAAMGAGNIMRQLRAVQTVARIQLRYVYYQGNLLWQNAEIVRRIRDGQELQFGPKCKLVTCETEEEGAKAIVTLMQTAVEKGVADQTLVLTARRSIGPISSFGLNMRLHDRINPPGDKETTVRNYRLRVGDRVIHTGDFAESGALGEIIDIEAENPERVHITVQYRSQTATYSGAAADRLEPANVLTIYQGQGLRMPYVIIPVFRTSPPTMHRLLLYTGLAVAQKQVVLVGNPSSIESAIRWEFNSRRNTRLAGLIHKVLQEG